MTWFPEWWPHPWELLGAQCFPCLVGEGKGRAASCVQNKGSSGPRYACAAAGGPGREETEGALEMGTLLLRVNYFLAVCPPLGLLAGLILEALLSFL